MPERFRPVRRWWLVAAAIMLLGLVPVLAFRSLGTAGDFAILGDTVQSSGADFTIEVNAVTPGGGAGAIGANTFSVAPTVNADGGVVSPLTDQLTAAQAAFTSFQTEALGGTLIADELGGQLLTPGVYRTAGIALLSAGDLTLSGPGDYLIYGNGGIQATTGRSVVLIGGANAANVYFVSNGAITIDDAGTLNGNFLTSDNLLFSSPTVVNGKLVSLQTVTLEGSAGQTLTINDTGQAPTITKSPADADNDLEVCVGDTLTYTLTADDPDGGNTELSLVSSTPALPGTATHTPGLPTTGDPASTTFEITPVLADVGTYTLVYRAEDESAADGTINERTITVRVVEAPIITLSNFSGQVAGAGTPGDPYLICAGTPFSYDVDATDADAGDAITLSETGAPVNGVHAPALPVTQGSPINGTFDFTPTEAQSGTTFTVTYSAADSFGCEATPATVTFRVLFVPDFEQPTETTYFVCVGDTLQYDLRVTDGDPGETVQLSVLGTPVGGFHAPNFSGTDSTGAGGGDFLGIGNPMITRFEWLPTVADVGLHTLTYTAIDDLGCETEFEVNVIVSQRPVINRPPTPADGAELVVCELDTLNYTISSTDPDGDPVSFAVTGAPGTLSHLPALPATAAGTAFTTASYTPAVGDGGQTFTVTYTASDPFGCDVSTTVRIRVTSLPVVTASSGTVNVCVGDTATFTVRGTDTEAGVVTLSQTGAPANLTFTPSLPIGGNPVETTATFVPTVANVGTTNVTFTATDADGCVDTTTVTLNVSQKPEFAPVTPLEGAELVVCVGETLTYDVEATDPDAGDAVTLSVSGQPGGMTHVDPLPLSGVPGEPVSTTASYTPGAGEAGQTFTVTYTATDDSLAACPITRTFTIRVSALPVISATQATVNICVGDTATFNVQASDAEAGNVTLSVAGAPASLVFSPVLPVGGNPVTTTATFTPTDADAGSQVVTFTATDEDGCASTTAVTLNVSRVPTIAVTDVAGQVSGSGTAADPYLVCAPGTGPADTLTYTITGDDLDPTETVTVSQTGSPGAAIYTPILPATGAAGDAVPVAFSYTPVLADAGQTFTVTYTAADSFTPACSASTTVVIRVSGVPEITATPSTVNVCVGDTATFRVRASDQEDGNVTLAAPVAPAGLTFAPGLPLGGNPVETVATYTPVAGDAGVQTVNFTATDEDGCVSTTTVTINVSQKPVFGGGTPAEGATLVVCVGDELTYGVSATDADATQTVTLNASGTPGALVHTPTLPFTGAVGGAAATTATYTPAVGDAGTTFAVTYTATDSSATGCPVTRSFNIRVSALPVITATQNTVNICVGDTATFRVRASDEEAGNVTLSQTGAPASLLLTPSLPATGNPVETVAVFTPVAGDAGIHMVTFLATDADGCTAMTTVSLNVSQKPVFGGGTPAEGSTLVVCVGEELTYGVSATDADATQTVTLNASGTPGALVHTPTLPFTGAVGGAAATTATYTPAAGDAGQTFAVTYTATDDSAAACSATRTFNIRVSSVPVITRTQGTVNICVGDTATFRVRATDADAGNVTLTASGVPAGLVLTPSLPATGNPVETTAVFTPTAANAGSTTVTFTATDADGCDASTTVVLNVSQKPVFGGGTPAEGSTLVVCVGEELTYNVSATDPDATQTVTLNASGAPGDLVHTPTLPFTGAVGGAAVTAASYTPSAADGGQTFTVTYTATDNSAAACSTTRTFNIRVSELPEITATQSSLSLCVGETASFRVRASDAEPGAVTLSVANAPASLVFTPSLPTGGNPIETTAVFTPTNADAGTRVVTFTATDSDGCTATTTVTLFVTRPPTVSVSGPSGQIRGAGTAADPFVVCPPGTDASGASTLTYTVTASDPDSNETVTLSESGSPTGSTYTPTLPRTGALGAAVSTQFSFTPTAEQSGESFTVTYTATDSFSPACSRTTTVVIRVSELPQFEGNTPEAGAVFNVCAGDQVRFRVKASDGDPGSNVRLTATGVPGTFSLTPSLPAAGNPVETEFNWIAVGNGSHTLVFTATDNDGCAVSRTFTINVSAVPTLAVTAIAGAQSGDGTAAKPLVVCVAPGTPLGFTVTGTDIDATDIVTLSQSGAPDSATFTPALPTAGTAGAPVSTRFAYSPSASDGGETFAVTFTATDSSAAQCSASQTVHIRVSHLPVATATPSSITVCEGDPIRFRIRASDQDAGGVTIGAPTIAPAGLTLSHTGGLPVVGNPVETDAVGTAPELPATTTYTITYPVTDADGCQTTAVVTVTVMDSEPSTISMTRTGTLAVGSELCYTAVVFDNCPVSEGGPRRVAGVPVVFRVTGETGNNDLDNTTIITNANGEARLCLIPRFPGTLMVSAAIDLDGDGVGDTGTTGATDTAVIPVPTQDGPACFISGRGSVEVSEFGDRSEAVLGNFNLDVSPKRNGKVAGKVTFQIPSERFKLQSTRITSMGCTESTIGREVVIFGTAKVTGMGVVRFRVDALDAGTPGVPNDRFTITLLDGGGVVSGPWGGNLEGGRRGRANRDDIVVRIGNLTR